MLKRTAAHQERIKLMGIVSYSFKTIMVKLQLIKLCASCELLVHTL